MWVWMWIEDLIKDGACEGIPPDKLLRWNQRGGLFIHRMKGAKQRCDSLLRWSMGAHVDSLTES